MIVSTNAAMASTYDYGEVARSVLIAILASYAALDLAGRVTAAAAWLRSAWLVGGAAAMGVGIWSMHFKGMLAFHLPVPVAYHWPTVLLSLLLAVSASAFALYIVSRPRLGLARALLGSIIMGGGIAGMHYVGMAAMRLAAVMQFHPLVVILSIAFAALFSFAALMLAFDLREEFRGFASRKIASGLVMGAAVSAMHYTGMASVSFMASTVLPNMSHAGSISSLGNNGIAIVTVIVLAAAVLTSSVDRRAEAQDLPLKPESQKTGDLLTSNTEIPPVEEETYSNTPIPTEIFSEMITQPLPTKPQPIAFEGEWISASEPWPKFPDDLIVTDRKDDGKWMWHVEKVNSCAWCGAPMTWKKAMFDKKSSSMWGLRSALMVADIEISHHAPCFQAGTCREGNPLLGQTRLQGYSVAAGLTAFAWIGDAWMRKGNNKYRVGGYKDWWFVPLFGDMASALGIMSNLATWKDR